MMIMMMTVTDSTVSLFITKHNFLKFFCSTNSNSNSSKCSSRQRLAHFICRVTGNPKPSITWYKNGVVLLVRGRLKGSRLPGGALVHIERVIKSRDKGDYMCKASNADGTATSQTSSLEIYNRG